MFGSAALNAIFGFSTGFYFLLFVWATNGYCQSLGWPHEDQADIARAWQRILSRVDSYADLEPELLGRVEQLIDFVTA